MWLAILSSDIETNRRSNKIVSNRNITMMFPSLGQPRAVLIKPKKNPKIPPSQRFPTSRSCETSGRSSGWLSCSKTPMHHPIETPKSVQKIRVAANCRSPFRLVDILSPFNTRERPGTWLLQVCMNQYGTMTTDFSSYWISSDSCFAR